MVRSSQYKWLVFIGVVVLAGFGLLAGHLYDIQVRRHAVLSAWADH